MGGSVHFLPSIGGRKGNIDESNMNRGETKPTENSFEKPARRLLGLLAIDQPNLAKLKKCYQAMGPLFPLWFKLVFHFIPLGKTLS